MGDQAGGSGWEIPVGNGQVEKFYIDLPGDIATSEVHLPDAPRTHKGASIPDTRIETLSQMYFDYLASLVSEANKQFLKKGA